MYNFNAFAFLQSLYIPQSTLGQMPNGKVSNEETQVSGIGVKLCLKALSLRAITNQPRNIFTRTQTFDEEVLKRGGRNIDALVTYSKTFESNFSIYWQASSKMDASGTNQNVEISQHIDASALISSYAADVEGVPFRIYQNY